VQTQEESIKLAIEACQIEATKCLACLHSNKAVSYDSDEPGVTSEQVWISSERKKAEKDCDVFWKRLFEWAWFTVNTRAVYLAADPRDSKNISRGSSNNSWGSDKAEDSLALAPYLDLLNHSGSVSVQAGINIYPCKHRQGFSSSMREIRKGSVADLDNFFPNPDSLFKLAASSFFC
jgi:hypothetical protein